MHSRSPSHLLGLKGRQSQAMHILLLGRDSLVFHHLPTVGPKQLYELAHLGCTQETVTS